MRIIEGVNKQVLNLENQSVNPFFPNHCLCFEHILNLISSGEVSNTKADDLVFDKPEEDLLKEGDALKRESSLKDRFLENAQAFTYIVQILDTSRENAFQPNENSKAIHSEENIHPHTNLTKIGLKQNIANIDLIDLEQNGSLEKVQTFTHGVGILDTSMKNTFQPDVEGDHKTPVGDFKAHLLSIYNGSEAIYSKESIHPYLKNNQNILLEDNMNNTEVPEYVILRQKENNMTDHSHQTLTKTDLRQNIANLINSSQVHLKNKETLKFSHYMPLRLLVDTEHEAWRSTQPEVDDPKLTETLDPTNEHSKENVTHRALDPGKLSNILDTENPAQAKVPFEDRHTTPVNLKNSDFQIKTESVIKHSSGIDKPDISYSEKGKEKIRESIDVYGSEFSSLKFEEELKATQEVRNSKHYSTQEHKVFHVKLEDGDLRIRLVKDRLNISLNLKEDIRLPTPHESYRLIESLSQMGLRVEFFGINGKTLQWEFRQGQEGKREGKFKDISLNSEDDNKVFSLYL